MTYHIPYHSERLTFIRRTFILDYIIFQAILTLMSYEESSNPHEQPPTTLHVGQQTPELKTRTHTETSPSPKYGGFVRFQIDQTPKNSSSSKTRNDEFPSIDPPTQTPIISFRAFGSTVQKPMYGAQYFNPSESIALKFPNWQSIKMNLDFSEADNNTTNKLRIKKNHIIIQQQINEDESSDEDEFVVSTNALAGTKPKRTHDKGLKSLSQIVLNIVGELGSATYKNVTQMLINQLLSEKKISKNAKDQTNVKRRAYDILNVLVAVGELKKVGKKINPNPHSSEREKINKRNELMEKVEMKRRMNQHKELSLLVLKQKYLQKVGVDKYNSTDELNQIRNHFQTIEETRDI